MIRIKLELEDEGIQFHYNFATALHGLVIENVPSSEVDEFHELQIKPFSQYLQIEKEKAVWNVQALDKKTGKWFMEKFMDEDFREIFLVNKERRIKIVSKGLESFSYDDLLNKYYFARGQRRICLKFITPCSFKREGSYMIFPDIRLIYQSLLNKFNQFAEETLIDPEDVIDDLVKYTVINNYRLRSTRYFIGKSKIPSFAGELSLYIKGPDPLVQLANLLFGFSEMSGIGVKTALGMGAVSWVNWKKGQE